MQHYRSLLRSSISSEGSAPDSYHFTPDKTEDISIVSPASARKTLSFSEENDSPAARVSGQEACLILISAHE